MRRPGSWGAERSRSPRPARRPLPTIGARGSQSGSTTEPSSRKLPAAGCAPPPRDGRPDPRRRRSSRPEGLARLVRVSTPRRPGLLDQRVDLGRGAHAVRERHPPTGAGVRHAADPARARGPRVEHRRRAGLEEDDVGAGLRASPSILGLRRPGPPARGRARRAYQADSLLHRPHATDLVARLWAPAHRSRRARENAARPQDLATIRRLDRHAVGYAHVPPPRRPGANVQSLPPVMRATLCSHQLDVARSLMSSARRPVRDGAKRRSGTPSSRALLAW